MAAAAEERGVAPLVRLHAAKLEALVALAASQKAELSAMIQQAEQRIMALLAAQTEVRARAHHCNDRGPAAPRSARPATLRRRLSPLAARLRM